MHMMRKRARLQLRMMRDARDMKQVVPSSRTSRIANLKKLPLTERGLKHTTLTLSDAKSKEGDAKAAAVTAVSSSAAAAAASASSSSAASAKAAGASSSSRNALAGKNQDKQKQVARHALNASASATAKQQQQQQQQQRGGGGAGVGIVFAHEAEEGKDEVLSVKNFVKYLTLNRNPQLPHPIVISLYCVVNEHQYIALGGALPKHAVKFRSERPVHVADALFCKI
jgi:hypothetical protein